MGMGTFCTAKKAPINALLGSNCLSTESLYLKRVPALWGGGCRGWQAAQIAVLDWSGLQNRFPNPPAPATFEPPPPPKTRSGPQRVRMSSGERPIGATKGKQSDTEALCQTPPNLQQQFLFYR